MAIEDDIIAQQRAYLSARRERNRLIREALKQGRTGYGLAKRMREELSDDALGEAMIRNIGRENAKPSRGST